MTARKAKLREVIQQDLSSIAVDADGSYPDAGILNRYRGMFPKPVRLGAATSYKSLHPISAGQLIYSKLFAWEGAVAVVPHEFDGCYVSSEFPHFYVDTDHIEIRYLQQAIQSDEFSRQLAVSTTGMGQRRQRVNVEAFKNIEIPLPPIEEQRRIAARLAGVSGSLEQVSKPIDAALVTLDRVEAEMILKSLGEPVQLGRLVEVNPGPLSVSPDTDVLFAPMTALRVESGRIVGAEVRRRSEIGSGYKQFSRGDIVFARITPSMQNGKSALFNDPDHDIGYGTTEFHVLRPVDPELAPSIHSLVRSTWFKSMARSTFTGTAGQQRVPASFLTTVSVPNLADPAIRNSLKGLRSLEDDRWRLRGLANRRQKMAEALPKSLRNELFSKMV